MVPLPEFIRAACVFVLACIVVVASLNALYASGSGSTGRPTAGPATTTSAPDI